MSGEGCVFLMHAASSLVDDMPQKSIGLDLDREGGGSPIPDNDCDADTAAHADNDSTKNMNGFMMNSSSLKPQQQQQPGSPTKASHLPEGAAPNRITLESHESEDPDAVQEPTVAVIRLKKSVGSLASTNLQALQSEEQKANENNMDTDGDAEYAEMELSGFNNNNPQNKTSPSANNMFTIDETPRNKNRDDDDDDSKSSGASLSTSSGSDGSSSTSDLGDSDMSDNDSDRSGPLHERKPDPTVEYAIIAQRKKEKLLTHLSQVAVRGSLSVLNLNRMGLGVNDVAIIEQVIAGNPTLSVLKLGFNDLGDYGAMTIANALSTEVGGHLQHRPLKVLDLGFNGIGDDGCGALAVEVIAGNLFLRSLFLSGNHIGEKGALSIAGALVHGCFLGRLHLSANKIGPVGIKAIATAVAETEARLRMQEDTEGLPPDIQNLEHLYLGTTAMEATGFYAIPSMLVSNESLKVLCLSDNGIEDSDMQVLGQALTQNKNVPLESLILSFNKITCAGVECLMNSIWGSPTLRELKLDNNQMEDRGAQLCAVVLSSVQLQKLDISFNQITTVGIRAIMKTLSEDANMKSLGMCGIPIDQNASKAVSFALAYNTSLHTLYLDNCSVGYSAQRHITAGIVSNQKAPLRVLTGFPLCPITVTLGMPQLPEGWSNEQVLAFVRIMWRNWGNKRAAETADGEAAVDNAAEGKGPAPVTEGKGPAPPAAVAAAAKIALASLGKEPTTALYVEPMPTESFDDSHGEAQSPLAPTNAAVIERTNSGRLQVPPSNETNGLPTDGYIEAWTETSAVGRPLASFPPIAPSYPGGPLDNPEQRNRNLRWLKAHFRALTEIGQLPFNNADMWQLHQYYFSPPYFDDDESVSDSKPAAQESDETGSAKLPAQDLKLQATSTEGVESQQARAASMASISASVSAVAVKSSSMGRGTASFRSLGTALTGDGGETSKRHSKRNHDDDNEADDVDMNTEPPAAKRSKCMKPRIAYYPRVRAKLESLGTKPLEQTLALLRKLKYVENAMFPDRSAYIDPDGAGDPGQPSRLDVEMVLLDLI